MILHVDRWRWGAACRGVNVIVPVLLCVSVVISWKPLSLKSITTSKNAVGYQFCIGFLDARPQVLNSSRAGIDPGGE